MFPNPWLSALMSGAWASLAGFLAWLARHIIKRVDYLEDRSVSREEFEKFCQTREAADHARGLDISRLEGKIDSYNQSISARIDRLLELRHGNR